MTVTFHFVSFVVCRNCWVIYPADAFCPLSSCRETERKIKGSKASLVPGSCRLATHTHTRRLRICVSISCSIRLRNLARGYRTPPTDGLEHSSRVSTMRQIESSPGSLSRSFKHPTTRLLVHHCWKDANPCHVPSRVWKEYRSTVEVGLVIKLD